MARNVDAIGPVGNSLEFVPSDLSVGIEYADDCDDDWWKKKLHQFVVAVVQPILG